LDHAGFIICCSKPEILDPEAVELTAAMTNSSDNPIQEATFLSSYSIVKISKIKKMTYHYFKSFICLPVFLPVLTVNTLCDIFYVLFRIKKKVFTK
jgi:hypothetical protein